MKNLRRPAPPRLAVDGDQLIAAAAKADLLRVLQGVQAVAALDAVDK